MVRSKTTGKLYNEDRMIYILNPKQAAFYMSKQVILYDVFDSNESVVFVFDKSESYPSYDEWCSRKPKVQ